MRRVSRTFVLLVLLVAGGLAAYRFWPSQPLPAGARADKVLVLKGERRLELLKDGKTLKSYRVALGWSPRGHKQREGDGKTPEGKYVIDARNAGSGFHRALHISYPRPQDRARARKQGVSPGGQIMIHGIKNGVGWIGPLHRLYDWTNGCIAVTDEEIREIWRAVPNGTPVEIRP
jgi:murein L,D-transpeptidase YafK